VGGVAMRTSRVAVPSHIPLTDDVDGRGNGLALTGVSPDADLRFGPRRDRRKPVTRLPLGRASVSTAWCQDFESELGRRPGRGPLAG
jgi:hypothetical protein